MNATEYIELVAGQYNQKLRSEDKKLLSHAFAFGQIAHTGQKRSSGEEYFTGHSVPVSLKIASLGLDIDSIAAGLLHDTIEDTTVTYEQLKSEFNQDIADLVEGVSKLGALKYKGSERHVESLRKFFMSVAKDTRVVLIKLCDRWHNLETLHFLPEPKQARIAKESILIHAQLASRLGIGQLVTVINDLSFPFAYPSEYLKTKQLLESRLKDENEIITKMYRNLLAELTNELGYTPKIDKRIKGVYSLYSKLKLKNWNIDEIYDLIAIRVIVRQVSDCYKSLGVIHSHWRPVPGRVKDYIALPKPNGYQSLHTVVFSGSGPRVEIQVRTEEMHLYNEYGVASHHLYKQRSEKITQQTTDWFKQLGEFQKSDVSSKEYLKELTNNFFSDRIFVLTPKGDVIDLPVNSTVLDFAYSIHSDVGDHAMGGRINGRFVALKTELSSEAVIEIVTDTKAKPSVKWLDWVTTNHAKNRIKRYVNKQFS